MAQQRFYHLHEPASFLLEPTVSVRVGIGVWVPSNEAALPHKRQNLTMVILICFEFNNFAHVNVSKALQTFVV